jgi:hypothetical protein
MDLDLDTPTPAPEAPASLRLFTSSSSSLARACLRAYSHRYEQGIGGKSRSDSLARGTAVHAGLEAWWKSVGDERLPAALEAIAAISTDALDPVDRVRAEELLRLYDARWGLEPFEVLVVEAEYRAPLVNPETGARSRTFERAGKIDAIVRDRETGRVMLVEHKTSREDITPGSQYWQRLQLNGQVSHYYAGAAALGYEVEACIYDVLAVPLLKPHLATPVELRKYTKPTKTDPEPRLYANQRAEDEPLEEFRSRLREALMSEPDRYVCRREVVRLYEDILDAQHDDWQLASRIRDARRLQVWPRNPDACFRYHRACDYLPVCQRAATIDDELLYEVRVPHSELTHSPAQEPAK